MKITIIHGQNHKGSTYHISQILAEQIQNNEVMNHESEKCEITEFFLPKDLEHFCLGCYQCIDEEEKCPFYEEKRQIMQAVEKADLLIFTTPTYCMRASASMKAFIDLTFTYWMSHRPRECMFSKKAVVISTASGVGTKSAMKDISNALFYWGVPYRKEYGIAVQAMNWEQVAPKKKEKINNDMAKLAKQIQKKKVHVTVKTKLFFYVMRMMQLKDMGAGKADKDYWQQQGWLDKERPWRK